MGQQSRIRAAKREARLKAPKPVSQVEKANPYPTPWHYTGYNARFELVTLFDVEGKKRWLKELAK
jgi:hypothetical protein